MLNTIAIWLALHFTGSAYETKNQACAWTWSQRAETGLTYVQQDDAYRRCMAR